jgi:hypothetical protein
MRCSVFLKLASLFALLFFALVAVGLLVYKRWPERFFYDPIITDIFYYRENTILESLDRPYMDLSLYYGIGPAIENARKADVLILGNSTSQGAFNHDEVQKVEGQSGISIFNLSTAGASCLYDLEVMQKNHLKPKVVLLNSYGCLFTKLNRPQEETVNSTRWQALMTVEERWGALVLRHYFQDIFPKPLMFNKEAGKFLYYLFSANDGCLEQISMESHGELRPLDRPDFPATNEEVEVAKEVKRRLEAQGIGLILIYVPSNSRPQNVRDLARILKVPCITACPERTDTMDGKHLFWKENAEYTRQFFEALLKMPQFQSMMAAPKGR